MSFQASPVPTWEPGHEANSRLLQTRLSTEQNIFADSLAGQSSPRDYFADRRCLPPGSGLIPVSLLPLHPLQSPAIPYAIVLPLRRYNSNGILTIEQRLLILSSMARALPAPPIFVLGIEFWVDVELES